MNISKNIKKFRNLSGISQVELAKKTGLTRNYLTLLENGKRMPSVPTLNKISKVLGVPVPILTVDISEKDSPLDKLLIRAYEIASNSAR